MPDAIKSSRHFYKNNQIKRKQSINQPNHNLKSAKNRNTRKSGIQVSHGAGAAERILLIHKTKITVNCQMFINADCKLIFILKLHKGYSGMIKNIFSSACYPCR